MKDQESLETSTLICKLADSVKHKIDELFADSVMATGIVIGSIFLSSDQLLRVEELPVGARANLI